MSRFKASIGVLILATMLSAVGCAGPSAEVIAEANSAKEDFVLGPEDVLDITVWRSEELTQKGTVVRPDGYISMPLIGEVAVSGRTAKELAADIAEALKHYRENPLVHVKVKEVNSYYVYVLGDVAKPGRYQLKSHATVLQAIAMAGGFTPMLRRTICTYVVLWSGHPAIPKKSRFLLGMMICCLGMEKSRILC